MPDGKEMSGDRSVRRDLDIARAAARALEDHLTVPPESLHVIVQEGWVTLEGGVGWEDQRAIAESLVRCLHGVRGVTNRLRVAPSGYPAAGPAAQPDGSSYSDAEPLIW